MLDDCEKL